MLESVSGRGRLNRSRRSADGVQTVDCKSRELILPNFHKPIGARKLFDISMITLQSERLWLDKFPGGSWSDGSIR
jgi:hypothetical protein